MNTVCPRGRNIPGAGARINNDFSQQEKKLFDDIAREEQQDDTKSHRGLLTTRDVLATTLIGHGQGATKVPQANRPQNQIETGWKSAWEGAHRSLSVHQKLRNIRNCSRRRREGHNSREGLQFTNSLSRCESYLGKKSTESNPGGRTDAKDQRLET